MITCERCQTENIEGSQYCDECGATLQPAAGAPHSRGQTGEHASPGTEAVASDAGRRAPELRAVSKPQPFAPSGTSVAGRPKVHEDAPTGRRESGAAPHAKLVIHRGR